MTKQRPVWGYFALAIVSLGLDATLLILSLESGVPPEDSLQKFTGKVKTVIVVDDLSGKPTALMTPLNAIHFTLAGEETVFRYPSRMPGYSDLYNRLAFEVDVWVDPEDLESGDAVAIYRLEQRLPEGWIAPPISVSYQAILDAQDTSHDSYLALGIGLLIVAPVFWVVGLLVLRSNRRNRPIPKAD